MQHSLCSCQQTLSLAVGKEENKICIFQNNLFKSLFTTAQAEFTFPLNTDFPALDWAGPVDNPEDQINK